MSICVSQGVVVRFSTVSQLLLSDEISISMLDNTPLPVEEKLSVNSPFTFSPSKGPLENTNCMSLSANLTCLESARSISPLCPIVMMTTTRSTEMNRLIKHLTSPLALECSHCNTPLRGVLSIVNMQPRT